MQKTWLTLGLIALLGTTAGAGIWFYQGHNEDPQALVERLGGGPDPAGAFDRLEARQEEPAVSAAELAGLKSANPRIRTYCAKLMVHQDSATSVPELTRMLNDPNRAVGVQSARTLGKVLQDEDLLKIMQDSKSSASALALLAPQLEDTTQAQGMVRGWLTDPKASKDLRVASAPLVQHDASGNQLLLKVAKDLKAPAEVRIAAASAGQEQDEVQALVESWLQRSTPLALRIAATQLVRPTPAMDAHMLAYAQDNSEPEGFRKAAQDSLGAVVDPYMSISRHDWCHKTTQYKPDQRLVLQFNQHAFRVGTSVTARWHGPAGVIDEEPMVLKGPVSCRYSFWQDAPPGGWAPGNYTVELAVQGRTQAQTAAFQVAP